MIWPSRIRLTFLWLSHVTRVIADNALRIHIVLVYAQAGQAERDAAWHLVTLLLIAPAVLFAPLNGAICNSLPKPRVLAFSAALAWVISIVFTVLTEPSLLVAWALLSISAAINGPVRYALLPAAAQDARITLPRLNGLFEMGGAAAIVAGLVLGADLFGPGSVIFGLVVPLYLAALGCAIPVRFPSDVRRPEPVGQAVRGFFADVRRIWNVQEARRCLLALATLRGLLTGLMGALVADVIEGGEVARLIQVGIWIFAGVAAGSFLAGLQKHPRRVLGFAPWGAAGLLLGLIIAAFGHVPGPVLSVLLGITFGLVNVPLAATYQGDLPADARGNGMAVRNLTDYLFTALIAGTLFALARFAGFSATAQLWLLAAGAALFAFLLWRWLFREVLELFLEFVIWPIYRIRGHGPGIAATPPQGPILIIANHTAWFDPLWIAKVLPRRIIPLLTSMFFDLPGLRWIMKNVAGAIRVESGGRFRREVPEIKETIAVLDRGDCVLIFPEGQLRKKDEQLLKPFGQGIWHILNERPNIPVVVCWIEGAWGSYFSYKNGPPTKNKKFDWWRRIDVAVSAPETLSAEVLADHRTTRQYLMQKCLETRRLLGLETPSLEPLKVEESLTEMDTN